jgi:urease accessory protein
LNRGSLKLQFANLEGDTYLVSSYSQAPFKVQRPFYPEGKSISHLVILHTAGGIVGGDELVSDLQLLPNSKVLITTATASKLYRSLGDIATGNVNCKVSTGACLEWLPQETIIFNGALYHQKMRIDLAPGATYFAWEITRYGRTARGERFLTGDWRSSVEVYQENRLLWLDRQRIFGDEHLLNSPNGLGGCSLAGTLVLVGLDLSPEILQKIQQLRLNYQGEIGVTSLMKGLLCRYRGYSTSEVRHLFREIWSLLRPIYLDVKATVPRIWQ